MPQNERLCKAASVLLCAHMCFQMCRAQLNMTAHPGQNITLPCVASTVTPFIAVEWSRPDLTDYVLLCRGGHIDKTHQHPLYADRVDLLDRKMVDGNVSLILRNVSGSDNGTYECRVKEKEEKLLTRGFIEGEPIIIITLTVTDPDLTPHVFNQSGRGVNDGLTVYCLLLLFRLFL